MENIGERIKKLREKQKFYNGHKLTGALLARQMGITQAYQSAIELGKRAPSRELLNAYASFFGVSVDYLLGNTDEPKLAPAPAAAETETAAAPQDARSSRAAFAQHEAAERCENSVSMTVPRMIAAIAQIRACLSELDPNSIAEPDRRTMSDLLAACQRALPDPQRPPEEIEDQKKLA